MFTTTDSLMKCSQPTSLLTSQTLIFLSNRYEPQYALLGKEYFYHAYGTIYALSAEVVGTLASARNGRYYLLLLCLNNTPSPPFLHLVQAKKILTAA